MEIIMNKNSRLKQIELALNLYGSVDVCSLSADLGTSEMTIRRDLATLADQGKAIRIHGGAILPTEHYINGINMDSRSTLHINEKKAIAQEAVKYIRSGDNIFIDDSSTVSVIADFIPHNQQLIITTTSMKTTLRYNEFPNIDVICLGGKVSKSTQSATGPITTDLISTMHFKTAFLGIPCISENGILSTSSFDEYSIKKAVIAHSSQVILLADSSKIRTPQYLSLADSKDLSRIITDCNAPKSFVEHCHNHNIPLSVVPF